MWKQILIWLRLPFMKKSRFAQFVCVCVWGVYLLFKFLYNYNLKNTTVNMIVALYITLQGNQFCSFICGSDFKWLKYNKKVN